MVCASGYNYKSSWFHWFYKTRSHVKVESSESNLMLSLLTTWCLCWSFAESSIRGEGWKFLFIHIFFSFMLFRSWYMMYIYCLLTFQCLVYIYLKCLTNQYHSQKKIKHITQCFNLLENTRDRKKTITI